MKAEHGSNLIYLFCLFFFPSNFEALSRCQGDCDSDDECDKGHYCFFRDENEVIPGCTTTQEKGLSGIDFCVAITYVPGEATVYENGLILSTGLTSRIIATKKLTVQYDIGGESNETFHSNPDGKNQI